MELKQVGILIPLENITVANEAAMMLTGEYEDIHTFSDRHIVVRLQDQALFAYALGMFDENAYSQLDHIMGILSGIYFDSNPETFWKQCLDLGFSV